MYVGAGKFNKPTGKSGASPGLPDKGSIQDLMGHVPDGKGLKPQFGVDALPPELREKLVNAPN